MAATVSSWTPFVSGVVVLYGSMAIEAVRARRNEKAQLDRGGVEASGDVYRVMQIAYPVAFGAMLVEGAWRGLPSGAAVISGAAIFGIAKALKWWAILTLGPFWTFRVIVVRGAALVACGPYRWLRHPNYVGVVGELAGTALFAGAIWSGLAAVTGFGLLLARRIAVEERALEATSRAQ